MYFTPSSVGSCQKHLTSAAAEINHAFRAARPRKI